MAEKSTNEHILEQLKHGCAHFELVSAPLPSISTSKPHSFLSPFFTASTHQFFARIGPSLGSQAMKKVELYSVQKVTGDGRCLFRALVKGMAFNKGISLNPREERNNADELRMAVKEVICDSDKERQQYEEAVIAITVDESLKRYCQRIRRPDFWGGESELLVLSRLCNQPIIVYIPEHEVLQKALEVWDLQVIASDSPVAEHAQIDPDLENAFICHLHDHWFCIRKVNGEWHNFDSLYAAPQHLSKFYLAAYLDSLKNSGWSIFLVRGNFPKEFPIASFEASNGYGQWLSPEDAERITKSCNNTQSPTRINSTQQDSDPYQEILLEMEDQDLKAAIAASLMEPSQSTTREETGSTQKDNEDTNDGKEDSKDDNEDTKDDNEDSKDKNAQ